MQGPILSQIHLDEFGNKKTCTITKNKEQFEYDISTIIYYIQSGGYIKNALVKDNELFCISLNGSFINLTGREEEEWSIIEYLGNKYWRCKCSCGKIKAVHAGSLLNHRTQNCGHNHEKRDLTGKIYTNLKVLNYSGNKTWNCECLLCGKKFIAMTDSIYYGRRTSCGCDKHAYNFIDLSGMQFDDWHVLEYAGVKNNACYWTCQCSCGIIKDVHASALVRGISTSCGHNTGTSKEELYWKQFIESIYSGEIQYNNRTILNGKELDIYLPEKHIAIEYNGSYFHDSTSRPVNYHYEKSAMCEKLGITLIHIFDYDCFTEEKQNILKSYLKGLITTSNIKIYARDTIIKQVDVEEARKFLQENHLQSSINHSIALGLYYKNVLVQLMSFGKPRFNTNFDTEIYRLCSKLGYTIIGGASKLFTHYIAQHQNESIISYCDYAKFNGKVYEQLGMTLNHITKPSYVYVSNRDLQVLNRWSCTKAELIKQGYGTEKETEEQIMLNRGFLKVYDSGMKAYTYNIK